MVNAILKNKFGIFTFLGSAPEGVDINEFLTEKNARIVGCLEDLDIHCDDDSVRNRVTYTIEENRGFFIQFNTTINPKWENLFDEPYKTKDEAYERIICEMQDDLKTGEAGHYNYRVIKVD